MSTAAAQPKAYSYIRWSSAKQTVGDSLRRQMEKARKYAEKNGLELDTTSFLDAGVSAFKGDNTATGRLSEFIEAVRLGVIPEGSYLLVEHLDRISRQRVNRAMAHLEELCELGINVVTLSDERIYTKAKTGDPMTFMYAAMLCIQAWEESRKKSERVRGAREKNRRDAAAGKITTAKAPAWLRVTPDKTSIEVIEDRAAVVRRIYEMYDQGHGQTTIAKTLNAEGIPSFGTNRSDGTATSWNKTYIGKLVGSKAPAGTLEQFVHREPDETEGPRLTQVGEVPNYYPPVVDQDLAERVWLRAKSVQPKGRHATQETKNILAGVGRCPHCDGAMARVKNSARHGSDRLICVKGRTGGCSGRSVSLRFIVDAIRNNLDQLLDPTDRFGGPAIDIPGWDAEFSDAADAVEALAEQIAMEPGRSVTLRAAMERAEKRLEAAREGRRQALEAAAVATGRGWEIEAGRFRDAVEAGDPDAANKALRRLAECVIVDIEMTGMTFHWRSGGASLVMWGSLLDEYPGGYVHG